MLTQTQKWLAAAGFFIFALLITWFAYNGGTYAIEITQEEAQERIDAALTKRAEKKRAVEFESVTVTFADDKIHVEAMATGTSLGRKVHGTVQAVGVPEYRGGSFYFHPTEEIRFSNISIVKIERPDAPFAKTRAKVREKFETWTEKHEMDDLVDTFKTDLQKWATAAAQKQITKSLSKHPLHTLKGGEGFAIQAVLDNVAVVNGIMRITLSIVQFGYTIVLAGISVILGFGLLIAIGAA